MENMQRISLEDKIDYLETTPLFGILDREEIYEVEKELEWIHLIAGETLYQQGEFSDSLYVVVGGRLRVVHTDSDGKEEIWGEISRGECVGETGILIGNLHSATLRAIRDSDIVKLVNYKFDQIAEKYPRILMQVARLVAMRLQESHGVARKRISQTNIAVVPASEDVPLSEFARQLVSAFSRLNLGDVLHLNSGFEHIRGKINTQATERADDDMEIDHWLSQQEGNYPFFFYECDSISSEWTKRCIREADRILIVGSASSNPIPSGIETTELTSKNTKSLARQELVLLHADNHLEIFNTSKWLKPRNVHTAHHVHLATEADFDRLSRRLTGKGIGLVLGGGGARGFAHIGVIHALLEANIPIDMIGGTSMGAVIAAEYALGWNCEQMVSRTIALNKGLGLDLTLPIVSLVTARRFHKRIEKLFGDCQIEDLRLPYFCISANLTRAEMMVHKQGSLKTAQLASNAAPGLVPPVVYDGDLLVDGFVLNNIPIDVMKTFCDGGPVIAVDVSPPVDLAENKPYGEGLSGWRMLWQKLNPMAQMNTIPNIVSIIMRSHELYSVSHSKTVSRNVAELYLRPPVGSFDVGAYQAGERIAEIGYEFAMKKVAEWKKTMSL